MKQNQKLPPKYWVVHDTVDNDVFINTAHKCKFESIEIFLSNHTYEILGFKSDDETEEWWDEQTRYKCELVEIKLCWEA